MRIPWKLKSQAFAVLDRFGADSVLYFLQRHVTKRSAVKISRIHDYWQFHRDAVARFDRAKILEFGAGKSLAQNIYLSSFCDSQTLVDLMPMLHLDLADTAARQVSALTGQPYHRIGAVGDLAAYRINYRAPFDLITSDFKDGEFDACISTNTLEHIPREQIRAILRELRRVVRKGGVVSAVIDYSDHFAHTDPSISRVEYLRFDDTIYERYNHRSHYQNRLRHSEHRALFLDAGFVIELETATKYAEFPLNIVSSRFDTADPTLLATTGLFVLTNP